MAAPRVLREDEQLSLEKSKAVELIDELLFEHLQHAAKCRVEEKFAVSIAVTFERNAHSTEVKAKISYSKKYSDLLEGTASPFQQLDLESAIEAEVDAIFGLKPS
jgi:hypothetical protein